MFLLPLLSLRIVTKSCYDERKQCWPKLLPVMLPLLQPAAVAFPAIAAVVAAVAIGSATTAAVADDASAASAVTGSGAGAAAAAAFVVVAFVVVLAVASGLEGRGGGSVWEVVAAMVVVAFHR